MIKILSSELEGEARASLISKFFLKDKGSKTTEMYFIGDEKLIKGKSLKDFIRLKGSVLDVDNGSMVTM